MKENRILSVEDVKAKYFFVEDFDEEKCHIEHNRRLLQSIIDAYNRIDKRYLGNLLKTAKHYADYRFVKNIAQEHRLDGQWDEIISKIERAIIE